MEQNKELNRGMEFIAIDMSNFKNVEENDKEKILSYLKEKYKVDVMDATFEQLEEKAVILSLVFMKKGHLKSLLFF